MKSQNKKTRKLPKINYKWLCGLLVFIVAYSAYEFWRFSYIHIDSDYANLVLEARDVLSGDFFRRGWNLTGISFLTTDLPYFIIGVLVYGVTNQAYVMACALMGTMLVVVSLLVLNDCMKKNILLNIAVIVSFAFLPNLYAMYMIRAHAGVYIIALLDMYLLHTIYEKKCFESFFSYKEWYIISMALAVVGDPIIIVAITLPVCIWCIVSYLQKKMDGKEARFYLVINALGVILGFILDKLYFSYGGAYKNSYLETRAFIPWEDIPQKFLLYARSVLYMSDAAFEEQAITSVRTAFYALNTLAVIIFFVLIFYNIVRFIKGKEYDLPTTILGMGFLLLSFCFVMTDIAVNEESARYFCYLPVLVAIVFARNASRIFEAKGRVYTCILALVVVTIIGRIYSISADKPVGLETHQELIEVLQENNLTYGYASYWNASATTVLSNEQIKVRAIVGQDDKLHMFNWFCKTAWYVQPANFVIVTDENDNFGVTPTNIKRELGEPSQTLTCGDYNIYVYDYDISSRLYWASEGELSE